MNTIFLHKTLRVTHKPYSVFEIYHVKYKIYGSLLKSPWS